MVISKRNKIIALSCMLVLLVVTGFLNVFLNTGGTEYTNTDDLSGANFFANYRTSRDATRAQEIMYYEAIINNANATTESKNEAEQKYLALTATMDAERVMEGLIVAKGFADAIVASTTNNINVMVKSTSLTASEVAQVVEIVQAQTGKMIDNIKIIPVQ